MAKRSSPSASARSTMSRACAGPGPALGVPADRNRVGPKPRRYGVMMRTPAASRYVATRFRPRGAAGQPWIRNTGTRPAGRPFRRRSPARPCAPCPRQLRPARYGSSSRAAGQRKPAGQSLAEAGGIAEASGAQGSGARLSRRARSCRPPTARSARCPPAALSRRSRYWPSSMPCSRSPRVILNGRLR